MMSGSWTEDQFLDGRITVLQPRQGYRAAIDPVLMAAAVPAMPGDKILELGSGTGVASLCLAARVDNIQVTGLEIQDQLFNLARRAAMQSGLTRRVSFERGDVLDPPPSLKGSKFDHVMANPPYMIKGSGFPSPNPQKAFAQVEGDAVLADWLGLAKKSVKPGGTITFIHRADRRSELTDVFSMEGWYAIVCPLWPKARERAAKRVIVQGRHVKGVVSMLAHGLVLHNEDGNYTDEANAILKLARSNNSAEGATLYITLSPCRDCSKLIHQAGIVRVVYRDEYKDTSGLDFLKSANVEVEQIAL